MYRENTKKLFEKKRQICLTTIKERGILGSVEAMLLRSQAFNKEDQLNKIFQKKKHQTADCIPKQSWLLEGCPDQSLWGVKKTVGVETCGNCFLRETK